MGSCWAYIDTPGPLDEDSLDKIYGVPHDLSIELVSGTTIKGSALDYSSYDQHYQFDLMKYDFEGGVWEYIGYRNAYASGGVVSYTEDVSDEGCGDYSYSVSAYNEYPDGLRAYRAFHCPENRISSFPRRRESRWGMAHVLLGQADFEKALTGLSVWWLHRLHLCMLKGF